MAAVFPEQMNRLNVSDVAGSLKVIEGYIRYMTERMEFANRNTVREVSESGISTVAVYQLLQDTVSAMSVLNSKLNGLTGDLASLAGQVGGLQSAVTGLQTQLDGVTDDAGGIKGDLTTIKSDISDLKGRVEALEAGAKE